jgi:hypothetical protein
MAPNPFVGLPVTPGVLVFQLVLEGAPNCGVFQMLKASTRNWKNFVSVMGNILKIEASQTEIPGALGPGVAEQLPNVNAAGEVNWLGSTQSLML